MYPVTANQIAWAIRTAMVTTAAVVTYLLAQSDIPLDPLVKVILSAVAVALAALNPTTPANAISSRLD